MALNVTLTFEVPDLSDTQDWFVNAQAWKNYWTSVPATVTINIANSVYVPVAFDAGLNPANLTIDGTNYALVTTAQLASLNAQITALDSSYQTLRNELKAGGIIQASQ